MYKDNTKLEERGDGAPVVESIEFEWRADPDAQGQHDAENCDDCRDGAMPEGCTAVATVSYQAGPGTRRLERFRSSGLWGICGADAAYRQEVERDELTDLRAHLARFGVALEAFDKLAEQHTAKGGRNNGR